MSLPGRVISTLALGYSVKMIVIWFPHDVCITYGYYEVYAHIITLKLIFGYHQKFNISVKSIIL